MAVSLRLDPKMERELNFCVKRLGRSKTDVIRQAIVAFLENLSLKLNDPYQVYLQLEPSLDGSQSGNLSIHYKHLISEKLKSKRR